MQGEFEAVLDQFLLETDKSKPVLVAVSGGVDSMVMVSLLYKAQIPMAVAHCNFQLRGKASDEDEAFVRNWCADRNIPFHGKRFETGTISAKGNDSIQMTARKQRYTFFRELVQEHGHRAVVLAHHADDRVESLLLNVLRGTGFRGLQGMPAKRGHVIRPLIRFSKAELLAFAEENDVPFREDASNTLVDYRRNWVRLRLLPVLEQLRPGAARTLSECCVRVESELPDYESWVAEKLEQLMVNVDCDTEAVRIDTLTATSAPFTLLREWLAPHGFSSAQVFEVRRMMDAQTGAVVSSGTHRVIKDRGKLLLEDREARRLKPKLRFEEIPRTRLSSLKVATNVALLDARTVNVNALKLRQWQKGDRFRPLGMTGFKLLSDFFIDKKLSIAEKKRVWLLTFENEIVWVVGMRLDDRFKVRSDTETVLRIEGC